MTNCIPNAVNIPKLPHHEQQELCLTRSPYRQGRKLTAVKVYTINDESVYLLINNVPDIKIALELANMCKKYGCVEKVVPLHDYPHNKFELTYLVKYSNIKFSRIAKKVMDGKNFFGGILHVCYAPELESVEETRRKLLERKREYSFSKSKNVKREHCDEYSKYSKNNFQIHTSVLKNLPLPNISSILNSSKNNIYNNVVSTNITSNNFIHDSYSSIDVKSDSCTTSTKRKYMASSGKEEFHQFSKTKKLVSNKISSNIKKRNCTVNSKKKASQPSMEELHKPVSTKKVI